MTVDMLRNVMAVDMLSPPEIYVMILRIQACAQSWVW